MTRGKQNTPEKEDIVLDEDAVRYALSFADAVNKYGVYGNGVTPMLLNARMKDINLFPMQATEDELNRALLNPKDSELVLQAFSQDFEIQSQLYKRLLSYLGYMLSFDFTYECINASPKDYASASYKKDLDVVKSFMDNFDYKSEFQAATTEMLRNEAVFYSIRQDKEKIILQELPSSPNYTMITGRWANGLLFSMNLYWFIQVGVDINLYDKFFKEKYLELWGENGKLKQYIPSMSPQTRGESSWVYWQDIPVDIGWCFKFNPTLATRNPYFAGLFLDLIQQPLMRNLQKNSNMAAAVKLVLGEIPLLKETSANVKDMFAISSQNLGNFLALVKAAIGESLRTVAVPLSNAKAMEFNTNDALYKSYLNNTAALTGTNSNLIFNNQLKMNTVETQLSLNTDEELMMTLYSPFENFINYQINKKTKNFKFKIKFEGTDFFNNREQRLERQTTLLPMGIVLPQKVAAAIGMNPFTFQRQLEEAKANGFVDNLTPIVPAFQKSDKDSTGGRPKKSESEISGEGEQTRADGGNIAKSTSNNV